MNYRSIRKQKPDFWLAIAIFCLVMFGLIAIYSVSKYYSLQITDNTTDKYYLIRQLIWVGVGVVVWIVFQSVDINFWKKNTKYMLPITLVLLILPIFFGDAEGANAQRWIGIGNVSFQPSELAKLTLIFYLAGWFSDRKEKKEINKTTLYFFIFLSLVALIMLLQKDLGTLGVIIGIAGAMFITFGAPFFHMLCGLGLSGILVWLAIIIEPYRMQRFVTFLDPENDQLSGGYHIRNALIALGSGGLWGLGFGQSKQKYLYLPESHTDSIFAIIGEELGFLRSSLIVIIFAFIALRGYRIAKNAPCDYSRFVAVGITTWFIWQAFINIAAMLSMIPLTGVPLPFISYGGSSLVFLLAAVGVLLNISKYAKKE